MPCFHLDDLSIDPLSFLSLHRRNGAGAEGEGSFCYPKDSNVPEGLNVWCEEPCKIS